MQYLTDFADQAVVLPVAAVVMLGLLAAGWVRGALAWAGCVAGVLAVMLALKMLGLACGNALGWGRIGVSSPSGHTASACMVYAGLAALLAPRTRSGGLAVAALACAVAVLVGITRVDLRVHSPGEVVAGALVGVSGVAALRRLAGPPPALAARPWLLAATCAVMLACHGHRLHAEARLTRLAFAVWPLDRCMADRTDVSTVSEK